jgi:purine-nucleoside phosphorylase
MLIEDHLNLTFRSIHQHEWGSRRGGQVIYAPKLIEMASEVARELRIHVARGVYAGVLGPSYESAAEIGMLARFGVDAVGMSTVLEAEEASARGLSVVGISLITNRATGTSALRPSHDDVTAVGQRASREVARLVEGLVQSLGENWKDYVQDEE